MLRGLSLDIDDRDDLSVLLREGTDTESGRLLARWGIAERVLAARAAVVP
jgi:2-phospho-L-lactate guanylyltransferase (CobY/MobA/RfbA family)